RISKHPSSKDAVKYQFIDRIVCMNFLKFLLFCSVAAGSAFIGFQMEPSLRFQDVRPVTNAPIDDEPEVVTLVKGLSYLDQSGETLHLAEGTALELLRRDGEELVVRPEVSAHPIFVRPEWIRFAEQTDPADLSESAASVEDAIPSQPVDESP
ncbi:MAG: hypothetical protein ACO3RV_02340, partial [Luteolibacter sp.]